ncbi:MAG: glycosyltransferase, partial [Butyrivibrio sp.]|nr:glycosyltransferase [Butyrivibrio sp.]
RFDLQKDVDSLAKVWALVQQRHPDWTLNVYGNGELKPHFEEIVSDKKLNHKIIIVHNLKKVINYKIVKITLPLREL